MGQIRLHWIMAALIVAQFVFHEQIVAAWDALARGQAADLNLLVRAHVIGGILILLLVVWRLALPEKEHPALKGIAHLVHWSLYALMIVLPLSGLAAWFGGVEVADFVHTTLKLPLLALVALHVAAAFYQQFVLRTGLIARMLRPG